MYRTCPVPPNLASKGALVLATVRQPYYKEHKRWNKRQVTHCLQSLRRRLLSSVCYPRPQRHTAEHKQLQPIVVRYFHLRLIHSLIDIARRQLTANNSHSVDVKAMYIK